MSYLNNLKHTPAFRMTYIMFLTVSLFLLPTLLFSSNNLKSINNEGANSKTDHKNIKSVLIHRSGFELSDPIIQLNSDEKLLLSFDDLDDQVKSYSYKIQHCNSSWEASELLTSEYIDGFATDRINNYEFSLNTTTPYLHYELSFPSDYLRITKSGNYLISVFEDDNKDNPVLVRKFKVVDAQVKIEAAVKPPLSIKYKRDKQEIGFKILLKNLYVPNPESTLKIVIQQNQRTDNIITNIKPVRNQGSVLDYNFNNKSIFNGGNEYRPLNIKSLKYKSERIQSIDYYSDGYHITLFKDLLRDRGSYIIENDINGQKLIKTEDEPNSATEGNYTWVHFRLEAKPQLLSKSIYLEGRLIEGLPPSETKLNYNAENNCFEAKVFLKQGYYDYQYLIKEPNVKEDQISLTEGSHYETKNEYRIFVYYREPGTLYDQLIGFEKITGPQ